MISDEDIDRKMNKMDCWDGKAAGKSGSSKLPPSGSRADASMRFTSGKR